MRRTAILVLVGIALAGCSSSAKTAAPEPTAGSTSTTTTPSASNKVGTGADYERLVAPVVQAQAEVTGSKDLEILKPELEKVAAAIKTFDTEMLKLTWPKKVAADVKKLVALDRASVATLEDLEDQTDSSIDTWWTVLVSDFGAAAAQSKIVRAGLGLPPA